MEPPKNVELIFIPSPGLSHLVSAVETAKLLLDRNDRLSITVLIMKFNKDNLTDTYVQKTSTTPNFQFINLPQQTESSTSLFDYIDDQIDPVTEIVSNLVKKPSQGNNPQLAGFVLDMFCTKFIDVANEFNLPAYVFFTSGACSLGVFRHIVSLKFDQKQDLTEYKDSGVELNVNCFSIPVPAKVLPAVFVNGGTMADVFMNYFKRLSEAKGIVLNSFYELEPYAIESFKDAPRVYPIGPILNSSTDQSSNEGGDEIKKWLDDQPENSVVFLCFGSMGSFDESQVKEIAFALENSGHRFLWSLRKPGEKNAMFPKEYEDFGEVLPEGFLERTSGVGKVIGWAPQMAVLSHPAVGGFVSHCGWNSTLESVWCGVPIATFPLYAEQQLNAFELVKELGMAEAIRIDYMRDFRGDQKPPEIVKSEEIEAAIRRLMADEGGNQVRQKVKEMQRKSRAALLEGGSSYKAQSLFIEDVIKNIA